MDYTVYSESNYIISYENYEKIKAEAMESRVEFTKEDELETIVIRKLRFENINLVQHWNDEPLPVFYVSMKNYDEDNLYLEKQSSENNITTKAMEKISREEFEKILSGDIEWMKNCKKLLLNDLYFQITTNGLKPERIEEYEREVFQRREREYISFNKRVSVASQKVVEFFNRQLPLADCLAWDEILVSCKQEMKHPLFFTSMVHMGIEENRELTYSF